MRPLCREPGRAKTDASCGRQPARWRRLGSPHAPHPPDRARRRHGPLKAEYDAAIGRAGKVFNIVKAMSLRPGVLKRSMEMYKAIMFGPSGLTRAGARAPRDGHLGAERLPLLNARACRRPPCRGRRRRARATRGPRLPAGRSRSTGAGALRLRGRAHGAPGAVGRADIDALRDVGLDDPTIHDAIQVIAYFNYINRVAEAVGIEDEPEWAR